MLSARLHVQKDFQLIDIGFFTPSLSRAHIQSVFGYGAIDAGPRLMFRFRSGTQGLNNESLEGGKG